MESFIIPLIILVIGGGLTGVCCRRHTHNDAWEIPMVIVGVVSAVILLISLIACPANFWDTKAQIVQMEAYYENVIQPNVVEEGTDYVVVDSNKAALWQAGESNLATYNRELANLRYWDSFAVIGFVVATPPDTLKSVRVK